MSIEIPEHLIGASQPANFLPFEQWESNGVPWAVSIGIGNETTINIVKNTNEIVKTITIQRLMEFWTY